MKGSYVLKNTVANANFFLDRKEIPKRLDVFVKPGEKVTQDTDRNLAEFARLFGENAQIVRHASTAALTKEFDINTFPAFVINNKMRLGGLQSADAIKVHYCSMNKLPECKKELTKSLV